MATRALGKRVREETQEDTLEGVSNDRLKPITNNELVTQAPANRAHRSSAMLGVNAGSIPKAISRQLPWASE